MLLLNCDLMMMMLQSAEEKVPVWYIMDEFGSRVQHFSQPTCCLAPLFYSPQQIAYSVLWPLQDLEKGGMQTLKQVQNQSKDTQ